ncbi:hypothetical protein M569_14824, partial [Genlisea aurea]
AAASLRFLALTPRSFSVRRPGDVALPVSNFIFPISAKPKLIACTTKSRFVSHVAISSGLDEDLEEGENSEFSVSDEPNFSPDLKLFVGNLPFNVDSAGLAELFEQAGNVEMVEVIYDKASGRSRGFGFVTMTTVEEAEAAAQQFNGYEFQGRPLRVNAGPPPSRNGSTFRGPRGSSSSRSNNGFPFQSTRTRSSFDRSNRVHVGNLAWGVDNLALETLFREQGNVKEATVIYDRETGRSKGFGFVTYGSREEVKNAIKSLDGIDLNGRSIRVSEAESRPKR